MATCPVCYGYVPEGTRYCVLCAINLKDKRPENYYGTNYKKHALEWIDSIKKK